MITNMLSYNKRKGRECLKLYFIGIRLVVLRQLNNWKNHKFVMVHHYIKKSQKIPRKELEQARKNMEDYKERFGVR